MGLKNQRQTNQFVPHRPDGGFLPDCLFSALRAGNYEKREGLGGEPIFGGFGKSCRSGRRPWTSKGTGRHGTDWVVNVRPRYWKLQKANILHGCPALFNLVSSNIIRHFGLVAHRRRAALLPLYFALLGQTGDPCYQLHAD